LPDRATEAAGPVEDRLAINDLVRPFARFRERGTQLRHMICDLAVAINGEGAQATYYLLVRLRVGWTSGKGRLGLLRSPPWLT
jgi:hypothetical protein